MSSYPYCLIPFIIAPAQSKTRFFKPYFFVKYVYLKLIVLYCLINNKF